MEKKRLPKSEEAFEELIKFQKGGAKDANRFLELLTSIETDVGGMEVVEESDLDRRARLYGKTYRNPFLSDTK